MANELMARRVPQLSALYAGGGWGLVEVMTFVEDRYLISPHWVDISVIGLLLLLPSVLLFTWNHGRPGKEEWTRVEKFFVPANLIVAVLVIATLFRGQDLGAVTTTVTIEDEDGTEIERVIPKSTFRKRVGLFLFEPTGTTEAWALRSFETALSTDLVQDLFVDLRYTPFYVERLERSGFKGGHNVPFSLKRDIAQDQNREYFVSGQLGESGGTWTVTFSLYDSDSGRSLGEHTLEGEDLMVLADEVSVALRNDLGIPSRHIEESTDLPVGEIFTGDMGAAEAYGRAMEALLVESDYAGAISHLALAVEQDPGFATAHVALYGVAFLDGQSERSLAALQNAVDNIYRLPERDRFPIRAELYINRRQHERALTAYEMWVELFPDDIRAYAGFAELRIIRGEPEEAIASFERLLEIDPGQTQILERIGGLHQGLGQFDQARDAYERFAEAFPGDGGPPAALGRLFILMGDHAAAIEQLNRSVSVEPDNVANVVTLAQASFSSGDLKGGERYLEEASAIASTPSDRVIVLTGLRTYANFRGRSAEALEHAQSALRLSSTLQPALVIALERMNTLSLLVSVGDTTGAFAALQDSEAGLEGPYAGAIGVGRARIFRALEQPEEIDRAVEGIEQMIEAYGFEFFRSIALQAKAWAHDLRGEYPQAMSLLEQAVALDPARMGLRRELASVLRKMGELDRAETELDQVLRVSPFNPRANLEMGLVLMPQNRFEDAREHLGRAVSVWAEADPGYRWAAVLEEALAELVPLSTGST